MMDWSKDCEAELLQALNQTDVANYDVFNPYAGDMPISIVQVQLLIEFFHIDSWYQQGQFYYPKLPMRGRDRAGLEISTLSFSLIDTLDPSILRFKEGGYKGQRVRVRNKSGNKTFFKGQFETIVPTAKHQRIDGSDKRILTYNCVDEFHLFRRVPIFEIIENTTDLGMIADLCTRYVPELDISGINTALGQEIVKRTISGQYLNDVIKEVLQANPDIAFVLDIRQEPSCICMDSRDALSIKIPIELTDTNIYQYCVPGQFKINTTGKSYRNRIIHSAPSLYNQGTVDVEKDTRIVYGTGTDWYGKIHPGDQFRIPGSESSYSVEKTTAQANGFFQEIYLTGDYQEEDATGLNYQVIGKERTIEVEDINEIEQRKALTGEMGENGGVVAVQINESTPLTDDEQEMVAENALRTDAYEGSLKTDNIKFPTNMLYAGQTLPLNMPIRGVVDLVPVNQIDWAIKLGEKEIVSNSEDPPMDLELIFDDRILFSENAFRDLLIAARRTKIRDFDKLTLRKNVGERYIVNECVAATEGEPVDEKHQWDTEILATSTNAYLSGPFYPENVSPGQLPLQVFDPDNPVNTFTYPV